MAAMPDTDVMDAIDLSATPPPAPDDPGDAVITAGGDVSDLFGLPAEVPAVEQPEAAETATPEAEAAPAAPEWQDHPDVQAWLADKLREGGTKLRANMMDLLERATDGDPDALKTMHSTDRRMWKLLQKRDTKIATALAQQVGADALDPYQDQWNRHERIDSLRRTNPYAFEEWRKEPANAAEVGWYEAEMGAYKRTLGLPPTATTAQMRETMRAADLAAREQQAYTATSGVDPDTTYEEFAASEEWKLLDADDRAALDPDNFADRQPAAAVKAMEREFGRRVARAEVRQAQPPTPPKATIKDGVRAAMAKAPPIIGGTPPAHRTDEQLQDEWIDAMQNGTLTAQLDRDYQAMEARRSGRTASWI